MLEQEAQIAKFAETEGLSRPPKKAGAAPKTAASPAASLKPPSRQRSRKLPTATYPKRKGIRSEKEEVSVAVRKIIGEGVSVERIVRSSLNPKYGMYIWYGLSDGRVRRAVATLAAKIELSPPLLHLVPQTFNSRQAEAAVGAKLRVWCFSAIMRAKGS